jgi:hypothetical protein
MPNRGQPFKPGNTFGRGRPHGSRNKKNLTKQLLDEHAVPLLRKAIADAYKGDSAMMRIIISYLLRLPKDPTVKDQQEGAGEPTYRGITSLSDQELERILRAGLKEQAPAPA